jgi:ATP-dependent Clp protease ATP-binding subunit ClpC
VGHDEGGQLTERVRRKPYSVILLDEIEKAHPDIYNVLLLVFDDGRLTDGKGRVVDFTNTIIVATSNLGAHLIQRQLTAKTPSTPQALKESLMESVNKQFRPEFVNRLDDIIVFNSLDKTEIRGIVKLQLSALIESLAEKHIELKVSDSLIDHIADVSYQPEYGAREMRRVIRTEIETRLAKAMLSGDVSEGDQVLVRYDKKSKKVETSVTTGNTEEAQVASVAEEASEEASA